MSFRIVNNKLVSDGRNPVRYYSTRKKNRGRITPKFLVIHYTAGASFEADVRTLSSASTPASCHLVIGRAGQIAQIEDFRTGLWHCGPSSYRGVNGLNSHSIGIEVTTPGPVESLPNGTYKTWFNRTITSDDNSSKDNDTNFDVIRARHGLLGHMAHWAMFNETQIELLIEIGSLLMQHYKLQEAVGHDHIATPRGRKQDPGPCCPQQVFERLNGRREDVSESAVVNSAKVSARSLNVRHAPNGTIIAGVFAGDRLEVLEKSATWWRVVTPDGVEGWVHSNFVILN